jgi:hypothetical protein
MEVTKSTEPTRTRSRLASTHDLPNIAFFRLAPLLRRSGPQFAALFVHVLWRFNAGRAGAHRYQPPAALLFVRFNGRRHLRSGRLRPAQSRRQTERKGYDEPTDQKWRIAILGIRPQVIAGQQETSD